MRERHGSGSSGEVWWIAEAYLEFAASSPSLYEAIFSLRLSGPFEDVATPTELRFAFSQIPEVFKGHGSIPEIC